MTFAARPTSPRAPPRGAPHPAVRPTSPRAHFVGRAAKARYSQHCCTGLPEFAPRPTRRANTPAAHPTARPPHRAAPILKRATAARQGGDDKRPSSDTEEICAAGGHGTGLRRIAARGRKTQAFGLSCTSSSILTLSLTIIPPASSATFHVRPKSLRLISAGL